MPAAYKLLEDNKPEVKSRTEKLFKRLYSTLGQQIIDSCPQAKLQRVCDLCMGTSKGSNGLNGTSSSKNSNGFGTGTFGANGNSVHLNSRV